MPPPQQQHDAGPPPRGPPPGGRGRGGGGPPEPGGGRGAGPGSSKWERIARQRQETHALLLKQQLARAKASPTLSGAAGLEARVSALAAPPELPPRSSFHDLPRAAGAYMAPLLLREEAALLPAAGQPAQQDHAAALERCLELFDRRGPGGAREHSRGGGTFDVSPSVAAALRGDT